MVFAMQNTEISAVLNMLQKRCGHRQRLSTSGLLREFSTLWLQLACFASFFHLCRKIHVFLSLCLPPCMVSILLSDAKAELFWKASRGHWVLEVTHVSRECPWLRGLLVACMGYCKKQVMTSALLRCGLGQATLSWKLVRISCCFCCRCHCDICFLFSCGIYS